jgi:uncharacterized membrane protein (UPF0136 family)
MVTPLIIKILFWVGVAISVLFGLGTMVGGVIGGIGGDSLGAVLGGLCTGPLIIVVGILSVRIYSELLILAFQIHDTLVDIKNQLAQR